MQNDYDKNNNRRQHGVPPLNNEYNSPMNYGCRTSEGGYFWQPPAPTYQRPRTNSMGVAGFVLSILTYFSFWFPPVTFVLWLLGLIFSIIGLFKAPRGLAVAGVIISLAAILVLVFSIFYLGFAFAML